MQYINASRAFDFDCMKMRRFGVLLFCIFYVGDALYSTIVCQEGFYLSNTSSYEECLPCTNYRKCPNGYALTACNATRDSHCDEPCENEYKPQNHTVWLNDCYWDCEVGYMKHIREFPGMLEYVCVPYPLWQQKS